MLIDREVALPDGRTLRSTDTGPAADDALSLVWHHGSPHTGALLPPLLTAAAEHRIRLVTYARPSYGGSTPAPGRTVASAADDVARVADAAGLGKFAVMGASGGGPHALACAALLPDRVTAAVTFAGLAPLTDDFDWFAGMAADGALRSAAQGRPARARYAETDEFDAAVFTEADYAALSGEWASLGQDAGRASEYGDDGLIDDDVAFTSPWGLDVTTISAPVLLVHGAQDRMVPASHSEWLARHLPDAELWLRPLDGHVSVLRELRAAMEWIVASSQGRR